MFLPGVVGLRVPAGSPRRGRRGQCRARERCIGWYPQMGTARRYWSSVMACCLSVTRLSLITVVGAGRPLVHGPDALDTAQLVHKSVLRDRTGGLIEDKESIISGGSVGEQDVAMCGASRTRCIGGRWLRCPGRCRCGAGPGCGCRHRPVRTRSGPGGRARRRLGSAGPYAPRKDRPVLRQERDDRVRMLLTPTGPQLRLLVSPACDSKDQSGAAGDTRLTIEGDVERREVERKRWQEWNSK